MTQIIHRSEPRRLRRPSPRSVAGGMAIAGAGLIAVGVTLPWLSLFAGLQPMTALGTLNGTLLLVGAGISASLGLLVTLHPATWGRVGLAVAGVALTAFSAYLVVGLVAVYREASADPLMVAQPGAGLVTVAIGSLLVFATAILRD